MADDPDAYTRTAALGACLRMARGKDKKTPLVESWFEKNPDDFDVIVRVACDANVPFPDKLVEAIHDLAATDLVNLLRVMMECGNQGVPLAFDLADHADADVRASALRILAANGLTRGDAKEKRRAESLLADALDEADDTLAPLLLDLIRLPRPQSDPFGFGGRDLLHRLEQSRDEEDPPVEEDEELSDLFGAFVEEDTPEPTPEPAEDDLSLDDLAAAFAEGGSSPDTPGDTGDAGNARDLRQTVQALFQTRHPETRRAAALLLLQYGDTSVIEFLDEQAEHIPAERFEALFRRLRRQPAALDLARILLDDKRSEVRSGALQVVAAGETAETFLPLVDALGTEESPIRVDELPLGDWSVRKGLRELSRSKARDAMQRWLPLPEDPSDADRVRALLGLQLMIQSRLPAKDIDLEAMIADTDDSRLRALAWLALGVANRGLTAERADALLADTSSDVRRALPFLYLRGAKTWHIHPGIQKRWTLDDQQAAWTPRMTDDIEARLRQLREDPAPDLRFLSGLALHSRRKDLDDPEAWHADFPGPDSPHSTRTLAQTYFMQRVQSGAGSLDPAIVEWLTGNLRSDYQRKKLERFASRPAAGTANDTPAALAEGDAPAPSDTPPVVLFVQSPGCDDCEMVEIFLEDEKTRLPNLEVHVLDIDDPDTRDLLAALYRRHGIPLTEIGLTPVVAGAGLLGAGSVDLTREFVSEIVQSSVIDPGVSWLPVVETPEEDETVSSAPGASPSEPAPDKEVATAPMPDPTPAQRLLLLLLPAWLVIAHPPGGFQRKRLLGWVSAFVAGSILPLAVPEIPVGIAFMLVLPLLGLSQQRERRAPDASLSSPVVEEPGNCLCRTLLPIAIGALLFLAGGLLPLPHWPRIAAEWSPGILVWALALFLGALYASTTARGRLQTALATATSLTLLLAFIV